MKTQRGFTLLELLVTIAILGVVSAMTFPAFSSWIAQRRLSADFEALQALTQQLQTQAQGQAGTAALVCSGNRITAQVSKVNAATPCQGLGVAFSPGNVIANLTEGLPNWQRVQVTHCDGRRLVFHADGSVCKEGGGSTVIQIQLSYLNDPGWSKGAYELALSQATGFPTRARYDLVTRSWQSLD